MQWPFIRSSAPNPYRPAWRHAGAFFPIRATLARITPPELGFEVLSDLPPRMHPGLMIEYRVRPLFGIPLTWLTEITHVQEPDFFVDEQRVGPYRIWHHEHHFADAGDGTVTMRDKVTYQLRSGRWERLFILSSLRRNCAGSLSFAMRRCGRYFPVGVSR